MAFMLWMLVVVLADEVCQHKSPMFWLSDDPKSPSCDHLLPLNSQLLGKMARQSPNSICVDDRRTWKIASEKASRTKQALDTRDFGEKKSSESETIFDKSRSRIHSKSSDSAKSSKTSDRGYAKKMRRLYECITDEVQINTITCNDQRCPFVLSLAENKIVIVWVSYDGSDSIRGRLFDLSLNPLDDEFQISSNSFRPTGFYTYAALLSSGYYAVVWLASNDIVVAILDEDSVVQTEVIANTSSSNDNDDYGICSSVNGGFLVTWWRESSDGEYYIQGRIFDNSGIPQNDDFAISSAGSKADLTTCDSLANGDYIVAWDTEGGDEDSQGILALIIDSSGTAMGDVISVNTYTLEEQDRPVVATLSDGNFVIAWKSDHQDVYGTAAIITRLFDSTGAALGDEILVNTYTETNQYTPWAAALKDGGFVVIWRSHDQDGSGTGVYGQRFDASANPIDEEFQINENTEDNQDCARLAAVYNGFIVAWESEGQDGDDNGAFARAYFDYNTIENSEVCETCPFGQYPDSNSCVDCREECLGCESATDCTSCSESGASAPLCCKVNASISGDSCSVVTVSEYDSGTECIGCAEGCGTCDSLGCLTCIISGVDCCSPSRVLQSDLMTCSCDSECSTCDSTGCLSCSSGQDCCPSSRYFDSDSSTCKDCGSSDDNGCLSCPSGVLACCPDGRFFDSATETCEECTSPCETCSNSSTECITCEPGSTCCGDGRYIDSDGVCQDCQSDCVTCSDASSCDICRDTEFTAPECCPDSTQDDSNKDGFCECLDGTTVISGCLCQSNEQWYSDGTAYSCQPVDTSSALTIQGSSEIGSSCSEDLEFLVTDFSGEESSEIIAMKLRWFSDSSSLAEYLRGQVSNPLSVPSVNLPSGTTTFTVYVSVNGAVYSGTHSVTKSEDAPLTVSLSAESLTILSSDESVEVKATVSSKPCPSVSYSWTSDSFESFELPESSSDTLVIASNTLPVKSPVLYTLSVSSGSSSVSQPLVFYSTNSDLVAVIDPVDSEVSSSEDLILNGNNSYDSSDESTALKYYWTCEEILCSGSCPSLPKAMDSQLKIPSKGLSSGMSFTIILTVYKGDRSDSASVKLTVV